jgi:hypothetical protein
MKNNNGLGFIGTLTLVFVVLKLTDNIDWSWWWVLSPLWIPVALLLVLAAIFALFSFIAAWEDGDFKKGGKNDNNSL